MKLESPKLKVLFDHELDSHHDTSDIDLIVHRVIAYPLKAPAIP